MYPKAGLFAPRDEKAFVKGVTAYMQGDYQLALTQLYDSMARDTGGSHVSEEYFSAFALIALGDHTTAVEMLERVLASPVPLPDSLMQKYGIGGNSVVSITPQVVAEMQYSNLSAALLLAELYQEQGQGTKAIELLESLGALAPEPIFALSLAELYSGQGRWDDVVRVTEGFVTNTDDATCQLLTYRGTAFREKGLPDASLEMLKGALRSKKRNPELLQQARYERGLTYEALGRKAMARKEFERIYAADADFADVKERIDLLSR